MEMVNRPYAAAFEAYAVQHPEVLCLSADLTSSCEIDGFRDRHPGQFLSLGMAEQNMLSFAGGLGLAGFRPSCIPSAYFCTGGPTISLWPPSPIQGARSA